MTGPRLRIDLCECGALPGVRVDRCAEDAVETRVECRCGLVGDEVEDAYADTAVWNWNKGPRYRRGRRP